MITNLSPSTLLMSAGKSRQVAVLVSVAVVFLSLNVAFKEY